MTRETFVKTVWRARIPRDTAHLPPLGATHYVFCMFFAAECLDEVGRSFIAAGHWDKDLNSMNPRRRQCASIGKRLKFFDCMAI